MVPTWAIAKPKIAVTRVDGDNGREIEKILIEVLSDDATVVKPKEVERAMDKLGLSGELDAGDAQRLQKRLDVSVVVQGKLKKTGKTTSLRLSLAVRDRKPKGFTLEFKSAKSEKLRTTLRDELVRRIGASDDDDEDDEKRKRKLSDNDDDDGEKRKKNRADDDDDGEKRKKKVAADDDDDDGDTKIRKKKRKRDADEPEEDLATAKRRAQRAGRVMVRLDAGATFGVRRLTYTADNPPPRVGTASGSGRIEGELYPFAGNPKSPAAGLGFAGEYDKTFGLSIEIPNGASVPIDKQHYSLGARYRFGVGSASTVALGVDLAKRRYVADRSQLVQPNELDAPDVDYTAMAPGLAFRSPVAPTAAIFGGLRGLFIFDTGPIQEQDSFGAATVFGAELDAGVDIALGGSLGLRIAGELSQINFKFKGNGAQSEARGVTAATDRNIALAATLAMKY
jgi:hypothetical protein